MTEKKPLPPEETFLAADNEAVIKHIELYQGIITRMAGNSAACKTWGIPLIAALLGFVIEDKNYYLALLALLTIPVLYFLDSYYLMLENSFIEGFKNSAIKIQTGSFRQTDLYKLLPSDSENKYWRKSFTSFATWPVYLGLFFLVLFGFYVVAK